MAHLTNQPSEKSVPLSDGQRRAISALLLRVAEVARHASEALGEPGEARTPFSRVAHDIPPETGAQVRAALSDLIDEANVIATLCGIPEDVRSARARLRADFSLLWSDIEDTMPDRLRGYGPVSHVAASALEPHLRAMARLSLRIARTV